MPPQKRKTYVLKPRQPSAEDPVKLVPSSNEFLDKPEPKIIFQGRSFCFTGIFDFENGDRIKCQEATRLRGGFCYERPNQALNYLVVGNNAEPSWGHGSYGRKIIAVLGFKNSGAKCQIISEELWAKSLKVAPKSEPALSQGHSKSDQLVQLQNKLDQLNKNHQLIADILKRELSPQIYQTIHTQLSQAGIVL
ncbi:MAG TPA: hypothetical protein VG347_03360 [Verrucomicrobiae bacterium]|nr:hypothetical protein [Verrucomicrobiae bacterium]